MDPTMIPRLPGPPPILHDTEDPAPSLSDWHDHEPNLEFDDSELLQAPEPNLIAALEDIEETLGPVDFELSPEADEIKSDLEADNYEDQLRSITEVDELTSMQAYEQLKFIDFFGTDKQGQHIFAIFACQLPAKSEINSRAFVKFIIRKMEAYVQNDYVLVYFHQGLRDKPSVNFLWHTYKELDRSFKKNLKALLVVHPTMFIKLVWNFFRPFISEKFRNKLVYLNSLKELQATLGLAAHPKLPEHIYQYDERFNSRGKSGAGGLGSSSSSTDGSGGGADGLAKDLPLTTQFGTTLRFITINSPCLNYIPPIVRKCVDHLSVSGVIDTEGIFRRSGSYARINALKQRVNAGEMQTMDFKDEDTFVVAGLLKAFLRDLHEPLLTYELYDEVTKFLEWTKEERSRNVKLMLREKLPVENYELFKYVVEFLVKVTECKDLNKMTTSNLSIVFGPNLIWAKHNHMSLEEVGPINAFVDFVLQNHRDIYMVDINQKEPVD